MSEEINIFIKNNIILVTVQGKRAAAQHQTERATSLMNNCFKQPSSKDNKMSNVRVCLIQLSR